MAISILQKLASLSQNPRIVPIKVEHWQRAIWADVGFYPHPGQARLFNTFKNHQYTECEAGRGSGKSYLAARGIVFPEWIRWKETVQHPWEWPRYVLLVAPQLDQAEIIFDEVYQLAIDRNIPLIRDRKSGTLDLVTKDGSRLRCMSGKNPTAMRGYGWNIVVIDEGSYLDDAAYVVNSVLKGTLLRRKGKLMIIGSPDAPGSFTHDSMLKGKDPDIEEWGHCHFTSLDNWYIPWMREFIESEIMQGVPEDIINREYFAEFVPRAGLVYPEFERCIEDFDWTEVAQATWIRTIDFGFQNPFACLMIGRVGEILYVWDEYYVTRRNLRDHAYYLKRMDEKHLFDLNLCDPEDPGAIDYLATWMEDPNNQDSRISGGWIKNFSKPLIVDRIDNLRRLMAMGNIKVHPRCRNLIREGGVHKYPDTREIQNYSEKPLDKDNHALDALGYIGYYLLGKSVGSNFPVFSGEDLESARILTGYDTAL